MFNIVFVGNPNVGKTTWINFLSGSKFKVANYNGVSVDMSEYCIRYKEEMINFVDLPGLYDLDVVSGEEKYTKEYLSKNKIDLLVNVMDIRNLKAGIHLCAQLKELHIPMIVLLNFVDNQIKEEDIEFLADTIHTPILCTSMKERNKILDILLKTPSNYQYIPFKEKDVMKTKLNLSKKYKLDNILLHPIAGIIILIVFLILSIYLLFILSDPFSTCIEIIGERLRLILLGSFNENVIFVKLLDALLYSLITFLSFLPFLTLIFLWMAWIEESGYMARIAYLLDPYLHFFNLSGNSVIPLLIGYGCSVPAILATRTIKDSRERKITALMIPFMSCSGKIPIYLLFVSTFFKGVEPLVFLVLYGTSFLISLAIGSISSRGPKSSFVIELPSYEWPKIEILYDKVKIEVVHFIKKIWKIMFFSTCIIVLILPYLNVKKFVPFFSFLGFTQNENIFASLPFTLLSKENLVMYYSMKHIDLTTLWDTHTSLMALCYLMYIALTVPCVMTLSAIKNEFGTRFLCVSVFIMIFISTLVCFFLYHGILLIHFFLG